MFRSFKVVLHASEKFSRLRCILTDPSSVDFRDRNYVQVVPPRPPFSLDNNETCPFEHAKVLHDRASIEISEVAAELARRLRLLLQEIKYFAPLPICKSLEHSLLPFGLRHDGMPDMLQYYNIYIPALNQ